MMIIFAVLLGGFGLMLSAFFGGTETGFYCVSRIRTQLDAIEGNRLAQWLLVLINHPSLFIATILFGNNIANYLVSMSGVILVQALFGTTGNSTEILATLFLTPVLFVYGEMFPKYIFMQAPERLLRLALPLFFVFLVLVFPISLVIWLFNRTLERLLGDRQEPLRLRLAKRELVKRFDEGQEHGIILPSQRQLTRNVFDVATQSILHYRIPLSHYPAITLSMPPQTMLSVAKECALTEFPVFSEHNPKHPVAYVRTIELAVFSLTDRSDSDSIATPFRELIEISDDHSPLNAMLLFQTAGETLALVTDENNNLLGLISEKQLMAVLFSGENA